MVDGAIRRRCPQSTSTPLARVLVLILADLAAQAVESLDLALALLEGARLTTALEKNKIKIKINLLVSTIEKIEILL